MAEENIIKFKIQSEDASIEGTRKKIEALKSVMLQTSDVDTFNKLALEAGGLETEIKRVEDAVTSLAGSGSELTKMSNSFSRVGASLLSMDFGAAAEEAGRLAAISKTMNFGTAISSLKSLGSTFMSLGKALLTNPFFLLVGVIVAIGVALYKLMDELGIITAIFDAVGAAIGWVIQQLKDLLDWLGLTSYAEDEEAAKQKKRTEDLQAIRTAAFNQMITEKELEIAKMQAEGASIEDIEDAEINLAQTRLEASKAELKRTENAQVAIIAQLTAWGQLAAATELQLKLDEQRNQVKTDEIALIGIIARVDKSRADRGKANAEAAKKRDEDKKKIQEDIANAQLKADEMIAKANIEFIEDEIERARQMAIFNEQQAFKAIDLKVLTDEQKEILEQQHQQRLIDIEKEAVDKRIEVQKKESEEALAEQKRKQDLWNQSLLDSFRAEVDARQMLKDATFNIANDTVGLLAAVAGKNKVVADIAFAAEKAAAIAGVIVNTQKEIAGYAANPTWSLLPDGGASIKSAMSIKAKIRAGISIATIAATSVSKFMNGGGGGVSSSGGGDSSFSTPSLGGRQDNQTPSMNLNNGVEQNAGGSVNRVTVVDYTDIQNKGTQLNKLQNRVSLV